MVRFSPSIKTFCLYVIWEKQDQIWAKTFCIPKNMDSRTPVVLHTVFLPSQPFIDLAPNFS